jgi:hypothetical protein
MTVRKTETRIPANFQASDLGESIGTADGRCILVSYMTTPLVLQDENTYVVFVPDPGLAGAAASYEWSFKENDYQPMVFTTSYGETSYAPHAIGVLFITVRLLDASGVEQARIEFVQEVTFPSAELEALITAAVEQPGPGPGDPDTLRELVNEHSRYYQAVKLQTPEAGDAFQRFIFGMVFDGALRCPARERKYQADDMAAALNNASPDFPRLAAQGVGVAAIRLALLAMVTPAVPGGAPLLAWCELPEAANPRAAADEQLRSDLGALDEAARVDLFNLARFPKSNITQCARIIEVLRDRYVPGKSFEDVLTRMSGTLAHWLIRHYQDGPLKRE